jgi:hypothetical protein
MRKPTAPARKKLVTNKPVRQARRKPAVEALPAGSYDAKVVSVGYDVLNKPDPEQASVFRPRPTKYTPSLTINTNKSEYYLHSLEVPMTLDQVSEYIENMVDSARRLTRGEDITSLQVVLVVHEPK